jgi:hypothetical protein
MTSVSVEISTKQQIQTHRFTTASYTPMKVLNIDTIGPVSKDSADNCYILVIIDCFSRFVELYPVSDTSAVVIYPVVELYPTGEHNSSTGSSKSYFVSYKLSMR